MFPLAGPLSGICVLAANVFMCSYVLACALHEGVDVAMWVLPDVWESPPGFCPRHVQTLNIRCSFMHSYMQQALTEGCTVRQVCDLPLTSCCTSVGDQPGHRRDGQGSNLRSQLVCSRDSCLQSTHPGDSGHSGPVSRCQAIGRA